MSEIKQTVAERLSDLLTTGKLSDTEFTLQNGDKVKGHKLIFAIASPVFEAMLYGDLAKNESEIMIGDIDPEGFKTMTEYIYTDNLKLDSVDHAISVYKAADKYDLQHLQKKAVDYVDSKVQTEYALEILEFSKLYSVPSTEEKCIKLLRENTKDVITSDYASKCSIDMLQTIVDDEELEIPEVELFKLVEKWAKCYSESNDMPLDAVKPVLKNIISKIRFLTMTLTDFVSLPFKSQLLSMEEKHNLLLHLDEPNSVVLLENFCNSTVCRERGKKNSSSFTCSINCNEYLIQWRLKNLPENKLSHCTPTFYIGDKPFTIELDYEFLKKITISVYLVFKWKLTECDSSFDMECSLKIFIKGRKPMKAGSEIVTFNDNSCVWGCDVVYDKTDFPHEIKDFNRALLFKDILIEANVKLL